MKHSIDDSSPYGTYQPDYLQKALIFLSRSTVLGRGRSRTWIRRRLGMRAQIIDEELFGRRIRTYLDENKCEWKAFLRPSQFDPVERQYIAEAMSQPNSVFVDIGANIGVITLWAMGVADASSRMLAFEPHPITFRRLKFNVALAQDDRVECFQLALGDREGEVQLTVDDLSMTTVLSTARGGGGDTVRLRPLLKVLQEAKVSRIDVLKIDVEGFEDRVIPPFLELAPQNLLPKIVIIEDLAQNNWLIDCVAAFQNRGYTVTQKVGNNSILMRT